MKKIVLIVISMVLMGFQLAGAECSLKNYEEGEYIGLSSGSRFGEITIKLDSGKKSSYAINMAVTMPGDIGYGDRISICAQSHEDPAPDITISSIKPFGNRNSKFVRWAEEGDLEEVEHLVKNGVNVDSRDENGDTALIAASKNNRADIVKFLIGKKADKHLKNLFNQTALHWAKINGNNEIVRLLK